MNKKIIVFALFIILLTLAACGGGEEVVPTPSATATIPATEEAVPSEPVQGLAPVDSVQVMLLESFPVQVNVRVRGELPNGCTEIEEIITTQNDSNFETKITTLRQADAECTEALVPFDEVIDLDVAELAAGTYTVTVNGISGSFTLETDNVAVEEPAEPTAQPTAEPTVTASETAVIEGLIWHDVCTTTGQDASSAVAESGCVGGEDGTFNADGQLAVDEVGIADAMVDLGEGACPAIGLATAVTDADGRYTFTDLPAGIYCVSLNPINQENSALLQTGVRTFPFDPNGHTLTLDDGDTATDTNFGWDYDFLPLPEATEDCTNSITFIEDLTIPDDSQFAPEEEFTKSWRIRNGGTCPWTTDYTLVYLGGDDIPGPTSIPLPQAAAPGQPLDISVTFTAPTAFGTYREDWVMRDANGVAFGVDGFPDEPLWLQIVVAEPGEPTPTPEPGSATIGGVIWRDYCTTFNDGTVWRGCVEVGEDSGFYVGDGTMTANEARLSGLDVILGQGACSSEGTIPTTILATTTTDADGLYRFTDLSSSTYCIFIDAFSNNNIELLIPGNWTWPGLGIGYQTFTLDQGEQALAIDFGWDDYDD